jgi:hypothetical protein
LLTGRWARARAFPTAKVETEDRYGDRRSPIIITLGPREDQRRETRPQPNCNAQQMTARCGERLVVAA